eukprot:scaffold73168_cov66-Phaeocystis_antarctica.AAC.2
MAVGVRPRYAVRKARPRLVHVQRGAFPGASCPAPLHKGGTHSPAVCCSSPSSRLASTSSSGTGTAATSAAAAQTRPAAHHACLRLGMRSPPAARGIASEARAALQVSGEIARGSKMPTTRREP